VQRICLSQPVNRENTGICLKKIDGLDLEEIARLKPRSN
jgi:hypothetical protein